MALLLDYATTIYEWLSGFAPTYRLPISEGTFDDEHPQPNEYITYSASISNFSQQFIQAITLYSKSTGYTNLMELVDRIERAIGETGIVLHKEWGNVAIYKGSPFYQDKTDEDSTIRAGYINLLVTIYQADV